MALSSAPSTPAETQFERGYDEHFDYVWRSLRRLGVPPADLGDLTHDVFVVAWRQRDLVDPSRPLRPWLFGVAFRVAASHRRKSWWRRIHAAPDVEVEDPRLGPEQSAIIRNELKRLQQALTRVPLRHRAILLLHDFDEVPMQDAAVALGIPLKTAYSRLAAARRRFRQAFRQAELQALGLRGPEAAVGE